MCYFYCVNTNSNNKIFLIILPLDHSRQLLLNHALLQQSPCVFLFHIARYVLVALAKNVRQTLLNNKLKVTMQKTGYQLTLVTK